LKTNLTIPEEMVCIWKKRIRWPLSSRGSRFDTLIVFVFFFLLFEKTKLDQSRGEGLFKRFGDHFHVEGSDLKFLFFW